MQYEPYQYCLLRSVTTEGSESKNNDILYCLTKEVIVMVSFTSYPSTIQNNLERDS